MYLGAKRCGGSVDTIAIAPAAASRSVMVGAIVKKVDFQAPIWSARFIGHNTSPCDMNGQSDMNPSIVIPDTT